MAIQPIRRDFIQKSITEIGKISSGTNGVTRLTYTKEESRAFEFAKCLMESCGLRTETDSYGNLYGSIGPKGAKKVMMGSHLDSVPNGGMFDGVTGVIAAIEAARYIAELKCELKNEIVVVAFRGEESARFGKTYLGSLGAFGRLTEADLSRKELPNIGYDSGVTLLDAMGKIGIETASTAFLNPAEIKAFVELHIEQGPVLERKNVPIGIVTSIAGNQRIRLILEGEGQHTGASQMNDRQDVAFALAEIGQAVEGITKPTNIYPHIQPDGARELVDGFFRDVRIAQSVTDFEDQNVTRTATMVSAVFDIRSIDLALIENAVSALKSNVERICKERGITFKFEEISSEKPVEFTRTVQKAIWNAANNLGMDNISMPSGAGHDAKNFHGAGVDAGMIFVPSEKGKSHVPEERTDFGHIATGTLLLAETIIRLAE
jgi:acetylornithine deacetylase/succinyl-diaminopimelate desuccinylase-like protein